MLVDDFDLKRYFHEVGKLKVMTRQREQELRTRMITNDITQDEKDAIRREFIEGNLRFVVTLCKKYQNKGVDFHDLVSEGNMGLMKAFERFDWDRNIRFISYSKWWVLQSVLQTLNENSRTIRLPVNVIQEYQKVKKKMQKIDGTPMTDNAIMPVLTPIDSVPFDYHGFVENENDSFDDGFSETEFDIDFLRGKKLQTILKCLSEKELSIIKKYFGLNCEKENLDSIGKKMSLSKERVRQIKEKAIRRLRNNSFSLLSLN